MREDLELLQRHAEHAAAGYPVPLDQWHPPFSGDLPIRIAADGRWYHAGGEIHRKALVQLFASILRREADGEYYLVTPVEKWRIEVDLHPLLVVSVDPDPGRAGRLLATLNTGRCYPVDRAHPLFLESALGGIAALRLPHGLAALFSRPAWYRLVDMAAGEGGEIAVESDGVRFPLQ